MLATQDHVSEVGGALQWNGLAGLAVGTVHECWLLYLDWQPEYQK